MVILLDVEKVFDNIKYLFVVWKDLLNCENKWIFLKWLRLLSKNYSKYVVLLKFFFFFGEMLEGII